MKNIELQGNSLTEIISLYRNKYNLRDWEVKYEIISAGSGGFLGFGKKRAEVRFFLPTLEERIKLFLERLLQQLGISYDSIKVKTVQKTFFAEILHPSDAGFLIGKNGSMLEQLQYLLNRVFERQPNLERIYLDTDDYRQRQEQSFIRSFLPIIDKVKQQHKAQTLEPMPAMQRRIIHRFVEKDKAVRTLTIGDGENKRIVIFPAEMPEKEALAGLAKSPRHPRQSSDSPRTDKSRSWQKSFQTPNKQRHRNDAD